MGGLVVKKAYLRAQNNPDYAPIINAVRAVVFLSTPHRGSNLAETLNRLLQVSFVSSRKQFIAELAAGSLLLEDINEDFRHFAPRLKLVSFYETYPTTIWKTSQMVGTTHVLRFYIAI